MKQTTNKKTNEVFEVVAVLENGVQLLNVETKEEKQVAHSTFKRWYTKPVEIETVVEETVVEETVVEEDETEFPELGEWEMFEEEEEEEEEPVVETAVVEETVVEEIKTPEELKASLLNYLAFTLNGEEPNEFVECKDNILAVRYFGKTVAQIKGKRKVRVYLNGRHMSEEMFAKCEHDRPEYTHNAFIKLEDAESLCLATMAIEEVRTWVRAKKQGK